MSASAPTYRDLERMFWSEFVAKYEHTGFRPRCPAESLEGLTLATGNGYCLDPVLRHGCRMWFDPSMQAEPGDVVFAEFHPSVIDRIFAERGSDPKFLETYGHKRAELGRVVKLLCSYRGRLFLVTNDSMTPLDGGQYGAGPPLGPSKILGVLRHVDAAPDLLRRVAC